VKHCVAVALLLTCACALSAQVFEVRGGTSSLYEAEGGTVHVKGGNYEASMGAGLIGHSFVGGANLSKRFNMSVVTLGSDLIPFNLPTDVFDTDHYITAVGASLRYKQPNSDFLLFGGMISQNFDSPFFDGARGVAPSAILSFNGRLTPTASVSSRMVLSRQITMIESIAWRPRPGINLALAGGIGAGQRYAAASATLKRSWIDAKAAYIETGSQFRRADVTTLLTAEPVGANIGVTLTPNRHTSLYFAHQSFSMPVYGSLENTRNSVDQGEANADFEHVSLTVSAFHSVYQGGKSDAIDISASRSIGPRMHAQSSLLHSNSSQGAQTTTLLTNVTEELTPRWSISQIVNNSKGQSTVGFGAYFLSNLATLSADYQTYYVPQRVPSPFEQALILDCQINLYGDVSVHGGTLVAPDGTLKHTVDGRGTFERGALVGPAIQRDTMGRFVLRGRVVDLSGQPVEGAALLVDRVEVFTDSEGRFNLREQQSRMHALSVQVDHFLNGSSYRLIKLTPEVRSVSEERWSETIIVVEKKLPVCGKTTGVSCRG
jgi:hypothetical protein